MTFPEFAPEPPPGSLSDMGVFTMSLGMVLGAGLIAYLPAAIRVGGARMGLIFPLCVILAFLYLMPYIFVSSSVRLGGGSISIAGALGKPVMAGMVSIIFLLQPLALATFGISVATYVTAVAPALNGNLVACAIIIVFFVCNLCGANIMGKVQNVMLPLLMIGLFLFVGFAIPKIDTSLLSAATNPSWNIGGGKGFLVGWTSLNACCMSYYMMVFQGRICNNAKKQIPKAMFLTGACIFVLYACYGVAAIGVLPADQLGGSLASVAKVVFPNWLYVTWMIMIPILLVATTLNSMMASMSMMIRQIAEDGWLPTSWAKCNKKGAPTIPLIICTVLALFPVITGYSVTAVISSTNLITWFADMVVFVLLFSFPKKYENAWKKSKLHVPNGVFYFFLCTAICFKTLNASSAFLAVSTDKLILTLVAIAAALAWAVFRSKSGKARVRVSVWE